MTTYAQEPALIGGSTDGTGAATSIKPLKVNSDGSLAVGSSSAPSTVQVSDGAGHTQPAGDAAARPQFVELSDGTNPVGTSGNPVRTQEKYPAGSSDAGQNLSLSTTNATQFASAASPLNLIAFTADPANTAQVHIARANTLTAGSTGTGIALSAGDTIVLPGANANEYYARTATTTQNVHALAL